MCVLGDTCLQARYKRYVCGTFHVQEIQYLFSMLAVSSRSLCWIHRHSLRKNITECCLPHLQLSTLLKTGFLLFGKQGLSSASFSPGEDDICILIGVVLFSVDVKTLSIPRGDKVAQQQYLKVSSS